MRCRPPQGYGRAFTLIEVMVVVVIIGVLATLATYSVRRYVFASKTGEATSMLTSIKAGEEAYKDETFTYLDVSGGFQADKFHPSVDPRGNVKSAWGAGSNVTAKARFDTLGVQPDGPVIFSYAVVACGPGGSGTCTEFPALPTRKTKNDFGFPSMTSRWGYVAVAKCNVNSDDSTNDQTYVVAHSFSNEIYVENEGQ